MCALPHKGALLLLPLHCPKAAGPCAARSGLGRLRASTCTGQRSSSISITGRCTTSGRQPRRPVWDIGALRRVHYGARIPVPAEERRASKAPLERPCHHAVPEARTSRPHPRHPSRHGFASQPRARSPVLHEEQEARLPCKSDAREMKTQGTLPHDEGRARGLPAQVRPSSHGRYRRRDLRPREVGAGQPPNRSGSRESRDGGGPEARWRKPWAREIEQIRSR
jgi:hypothetical protein